MRFPFHNLKFGVNATEHNFLLNYEFASEIPLLPHPGAFGKLRKNHIHEGIDLYCENGKSVVAMESGTIVGIYNFTGESVNSPWWNETSCILIEGETGVLNYGEILVSDGLCVGQWVNEGQEIGTVTPVLKTSKGRPMCMLHLELYKHGTKKHIDEWSIGAEKPLQLLDPTFILLHLLRKNHDEKINQRSNEICTA